MVPRLLALTAGAIAVMDASAVQHNSCVSPAYPRQQEYAVTVEDRDPVGGGAPLISNQGGTSDFAFTFGAAWFPGGMQDGDSPDGLVMRTVECNPNHYNCSSTAHPEWGNAGAIAFVRADISASPPRADHVGESSVQWPGCNGPPPSDTPRWGAADPRVTYRRADKTYYLTWDNCTNNCFPHRSTLLSTSKNPFDPKGWTLHGPVIPGAYTAGVSLLFRDEGVLAGTPHLAFVADSVNAGSLVLAESKDGITWTLAPNSSGRLFMKGREGCWDAPGVAAGPQPERLSTGDFLYIYNVDTGYPYHPNPVGRCAIGWAILDGEDPTRIVARSDSPLLTAVFPWEQCPVKNSTCQETMVVFSTGLKPLGNDEFLVVYGGGDTDVGLAKIKVRSKTFDVSS